MLSELAKYIYTDDGVKLTYFVLPCPGASYTLVMLHGLASNHSRWSEFINHTQLSNYMNLLTMDLRGHAGSMTQNRKIGHKAWIKDLHKILQKESLDKIILVGHSMGAQLALHYAEAYPHSVSGLMLIDPTIPKELRGKLAVARRLRFLLWLAVVMFLFASKFKTSKKTYPFYDLHELDLKTRERMISESVDVIAKLYTSPGEDLKYLPLVNYLQDLYAVTSPLPDLSKIKCPTRVLLSKSSSIVNPANMKAYFSNKAGLDILSVDANHWPLTERPDECRQAIDEWCLKLLNSQLKKI